MAAVFVDQKLKIDDPVGAVAVHGVCGAWGIIGLGLFANGTYGDGLNGVSGSVKGLLYGDSGQLVASIAGIVVNIVWVGAMAFIGLKVVNAIVGNRVSKEVEIAGLDEDEMGLPGYAAEPGHALPPELAVASAATAPTPAE
jgi:Amt family ammonium transporter